MIRLARVMLSIGAFAIALPAAPVPRELGYNLQYFRVHDAAADLPSKPAGRVPACVIDLRYVKGKEAAATALAGWLKDRASARTPVFILANADTGSALRAVLAPQERAPGVVVVGIPAAGFQPDVEVRATAEQERRAFDAYDQGIAIAALLADNPDKVRNDESSLSRDRLAEASADATGDALAGQRPAPPVDLTLQRAVHLHRALLALKKI